MLLEQLGLEAFLHILFKNGYHVLVRKLNLVPLHDQDALLEIVQDMLHLLPPLLRGFDLHHNFCAQLALVAKEEEHKAENGRAEDADENKVFWLLQIFILVGAQDHRGKDARAEEDASRPPGHPGHLNAGDEGDAVD